MAFYRSEMRNLTMSLKPNIPETFQNCLSAILETRGISATQLAAMLGYKSKTTLLRILLPLCWLGMLWQN